MNADEFRSIALSIPGSVESSHQGHPDFRLGGKVFASLGYPDEEHGMVKLTSDQQEMFLKKGSGVFTPCAGMWGKRGATSVHLRSAKVGLVREALESAAKNVVEKKKG